MLPLAKIPQLTELDLVYVTRCHETRHGAGPLPHALAGKPWPNVEDATNVPHDYQGSIRFGWLNLGRMAHLIQTDMADARMGPLHTEPKPRRNLP